MTVDHSARLLLTALTSARDSPPAQRADSWEAVWQVALGTDDLNVLARRLFDVYDLANEMRQDLAQTGIAPTAYEGPILTFETGCFRLKSDTAWNQCWANIKGDELVRTVEFAVGVLDREVLLAVAAIDDVDGLREELRRILALVLTSTELDAAVKDLVLHHLNGMLDALDGVGSTRTSGAFVRSIDALGGVLAYGPLSKALQSTKVGAVVLALFAGAWVGTGHPLPGTGSGLELPPQNQIIVECIRKPTPKELAPGKPELGPAAERETASLNP